MEDAMPPVLAMRDLWTFEDLQQLDVEDWHRYEIVDGALLVSPSPGGPHERVIANLHRSLVLSAPSDVMVMSGNFGIGFDRSYRVADVVVVPDDGRSMGAYLRPADVLLAVEVVSPGSVTSDRLVKPAQYAAAGIANFWRVELDPLSLTAYRLPHGGSAYAEVGTWVEGETAVLREPFAVDIEITRLR